MCIFPSDSRLGGIDISSFAGVRFRRSKKYLKKIGETDGIAGKRAMTSHSDNHATGWFWFCHTGHRG